MEPSGTHEPQKSRWDTYTLWLSNIIHDLYTAISINIVGSKRQSLKTRPQGIVGFSWLKFIKISHAWGPFSEHLRWQAIWIKEMLGYQEDDVAAKELSNGMCQKF